MATSRSTTTGSDSTAALEKKIDEAAKKIAALEKQLAALKGELKSHVDQPAPAAQAELPPGLVRDSGYTSWKQLVSKKLGIRL